jgi:hypothetical protein
MVLDMLRFKVYPAFLSGSLYRRSRHAKIDNAGDEFSCFRQFAFA